MADTPQEPPPHTPLADTPETSVPFSASSALAAISRISRTTGLFTKGFGRAPLVPEHVLGVKAQVQAASELPYTPYTRFHPRQSEPQPPNSIEADSSIYKDDTNGRVPLHAQSPEDPSLSTLAPSSSGINAGTTDIPMCSSPLSRSNRTRFRRPGGPDRSTRRSTHTERQREGLPISRNWDTSGGSGLAPSSPTPTSVALSEIVWENGSSTSQDPTPPVAYAVLSGEDLASIRGTPSRSVTPVAAGSATHSAPFSITSSGSHTPMDEDQELGQSFPASSSAITPGDLDRALASIHNPNDIAMKGSIPAISISPTVNNHPPVFSPIPIPLPPAPQTSTPTSYDVAMQEPTPSAPADHASHPSIHPRLPRPVPLPPVSTALADVIGKAVAEHLSSELLEPTVRNIVDACVPRLVEVLETRFIPKKLSGGGCAGGLKTSDRDADPGGSDGDDEGEEMSLPARRKKPGPRGGMNRLHNAFRVYLRSKNILPNGPKGALPISAPAVAIQAFNQNGESPPVLKDIALDWASNPLSASAWNREAIAILSLDFHTQLKSGACKEVVYSEEAMNLSAIRLLCKKKLIRTHQAHRKQSLIHNATVDDKQEIISSLKEKDGKRLKDERKVSRRFGTLSRRKKIVAQNRSRDPETWDAIQKIITQLGVEGMSADETDNPQKPKTLRRMELPWLHPSLSLLFKSVESYEPAFRTENMREHIGQSSFVRHWEPRSKDTRSGPVGGLPRNWYNDDWFRGLSNGARSMLVVRQEKAIPALHPWPQAEPPPAH